MAGQYERFVALGDSQTEGCNDVGPDGRWRGWADRFAERLAETTSPGLTYANLAVGGCRAKHVLDVQVPAALALEPDLASVCVGMNDLLRHDFDLAATAAQIEASFAALRATGCRVFTVGFPDVALMLPVMGWLRPREAELNDRVGEAAARHDVDVLDLFSLDLAADPGMWSHDRIHGSALGHERIAAGACELFGLPGSDHSWAQVTGAVPRGLGVVRRDAWWVASFVGPFLVKQVRGRGQGPGAKRPQLLPVLPSENDDGRPTLAGEAAV
ncbi:SGNH/GDSL hydrolase family protein [Marmoricola sp. OAE513]|uniref:SGNH/GDSL hydrolase family protein n=1 Tax=Marmoricola sp. OAE513 TaxID=2817894 RepID=UPI001AE25524